MGIAVIGTTFVDVKGHPHGKCVPAGRNAGRVIEVHGGVARNIAEDIANVGLAPAFVSVVDESGLSDDIVGRLAQRGCNTSYIGRAEGGLGMWLAIFDEAGDVVASISRRPDTSGIERILIDRGDEIISQASSVYIDFDIDAPILERVLDLAQRQGPGGILRNRRKARGVHHRKRGERVRPLLPGRARPWLTGQRYGQILLRSLIWPLGSSK